MLVVDGKRRRTWSCSLFFSETDSWQCSIRRSQSEGVPSSSLFFFFLLPYVGCKQSSCSFEALSTRSMEAKSLFSLHRALAQPVKMCMFDFPVTILDDLVSSESDDRV